MSRRSRLQLRKNQRGLTLVEIMVAMAISLFLLAGLIQIFISSKATYRMTEGLSRVQENGRFALDLMARNLRMAGYMGCIRDVPVHNNLNNSSDFAYELGTGLEGFEASGTSTTSTFTISATNPAPSTTAADWSPALDSSLVGSVIPGSDVIVIRFMSPAAIGLVDPFQESGGLFVHQDNDLAIGEILVVTDCSKASIFQATNVQDAGSGPSDPKTRVVHSNSSMTPGNVNPQLGQSYGEGAEVARAQAFIYYVGRSANGEPALFQRSMRRFSDTDSHLQSDELIPGVESMQVLYGVDSNEDGAADSYQTASGSIDWGSVVSIRIGLLMRSPDVAATEDDTNKYNVLGTQIDPVDDRRLRRVFTTTVAIRNRTR